MYRPVDVFLLVIDAAETHVPARIFFFNDTAPTEIYTSIDTLSLHDALPIWVVFGGGAVFFVVLVAAGALVMPPPLAVSLSVSLEALSALASARFAASAESFLSESCFAASPLQAASVNVAIARDAAVRRVYFTIGYSSLE